MRERQLNSTTHPLTFLLVSSTDHVSPVTGATATVTLSKDGAAFAAPAGAVTEIANGWYALAGNATDRNTLGSLILHATATGADPLDVQYDIVAYDPYDAQRLGLGALPASGTLAVKPAVTLAAADVTGNVAADLQTIKTQVVTCAGAVTVPAATLASTTNITAGTITTATNLTNAPTAGDFTTVMKASLNASTPAGIIGNISGNVSGSVGSLATGAITAASIAAAALNGKGDWLLASSYTAPPSAAVIATAVLTDTTASDFATVGSLGHIIVTQLGGTFTTTGSSVFTAPALANGPSGSGSSPAAIATAIFTDLMASADFSTVGSFGALVKANLDTNVNSRLATSAYAAPDNAGIGNIVAKLPANTIADETLVLNATNAIMTAVGTPMQANALATLAATQPNYAPAKAGDQMDLVIAPNATAITAIQNGLSKPNLAQTIDGTSPLAESYSSGALTLSQALYEIAQVVGENGVTGTTITVRKRDKTTTAATFTVNDSAAPTNRTRAT